MCTLVCLCTFTCAYANSAVASKNEIKAQSLPTSFECILWLLKENNHPPVGGSGTSSSTLNVLLLPIKFNWNVIQFIFKEISRFMKIVLSRRRGVASSLFSFMCGSA